MTDSLNKNTYFKDENLSSDRNKYSYKYHNIEAEKRKKIKAMNLTRDLKNINIKTLKNKERKCPECPVNHVLFSMEDIRYRQNLNKLIKLLRSIYGSSSVYFIYLTSSSFLVTFPSCLTVSLGF